MTGSRTCGAVAGALEHDELAARVLGERRRRGVTRLMRVLSPWMTSTGQRTRAADCARLVRRRDAARTCATSVSAVVSSPQPTASSIGFVECGSVNICAMKNSTKSAVVAQPVVLVVLRPALVGVELVVAVGYTVAPQARSPPPTSAPAPMKTAASTRSGCSAARSSAALRAEREADDHRLLRPRRIQHREGVGCELALVVRLRLRGRSERPLPRPSKVTTRQWRARYGICIFQCREWMIDHVGRSSTVGSPAP